MGRGEEGGLAIYAFPKIKKYRYTAVYSFK